MRKRIHVAVGVIHRADGRILIARRAANQHLGGLWEFPGGKVENGESVSVALARELYEELGIVIGALSPLCKIQHDYPDKSVLLDVWHVHNFSGEAQGREGQPLRWVAPAELEPGEFPDANRAIIRALGLPDFLAILPVDKVRAALPDHALIDAILTLNQQHPGNLIIRWRAESALPSAAITRAVAAHHARLIVDLHSADDRRWQTLDGIAGVHANRHLLQTLAARPVPDQLLFGVSCHNLEELMHASRLGADYALLSPVKHSTSHPEQAGMGWELFTTWAAQANCAVYAMGGMCKADLSTAKACGARGIAGISLFSEEPTA